MTKEKYIAAERAFVKMTDLKVGSIVKVTRAAEGHEHGWQASWVEKMTQNIGKELVVTALCHDDAGGVELGGDYWYPFFVLEVMPNALPAPIKLNNSGGYEAKFALDGSISVGCQDISFATLEKIYKEAAKLAKKTK